jgi:hypothetical protein
MIVKRGEYQSKPTLSFCQSEDDRWPVTMGPRKLVAIIKNIPEALSFLSDMGGDEGKAAVNEFYKQFQPAEPQVKKTKKVKAEAKS